MTRQQESRSLPQTRRGLWWGALAIAVITSPPALLWSAWLEHAGFWSLLVMSTGWGLLWAAVLREAFRRGQLLWVRDFLTMLNR